MLVVVVTSPSFNGVTWSSSVMIPRLQLVLYHYFETPTGLKFVMLTDTNVGSLNDSLWDIYSKLYVEYVVKNPLYRPGEWVDS